MKILQYFLIIILAGFAIFASNTMPSFADGFLPSPLRLTHGPMICGLEPKQDSQFPDIGKKFLDETKYAVIDWALKLNQGMGKHPAWNLTSVSIPLYEQDTYDYSKCDITINFLPKPDNSDLGYGLVGFTIPNFELHKSRVEIYYLGIENGVYTGTLASDPQIKGTIRHEMGHAMGLGHYVVSEQETDNIVHGIEDMPSIMIPIETVIGVTHFDITPFDISQIKSIYGYTGFGSTSKVDYKKTNMISFDKSIYSPEDKIELSIKTSELPDNDQSGFFLIIDSNNKIIQIAGVSNQNPSPFYINQNGYQNPGKYYVEFMDSNAAIYDYTSFTVSGDSIPSQTETKLPTPNSPVSIPSWIKHNAKWWAESSLTDDDFIKGIQYLIQQGIITIPPTQLGSASSQQIPVWIKNNAGWWADGKISDDEFVKGIQYLISNGMLKVKTS